MHVVSHVMSTHAVTVAGVTAQRSLISYVQLASVLHVVSSVMSAHAATVAGVNVQTPVVSYVQLASVLHVVSSVMSAHAATVAEVTAQVCCGGLYVQSPAPVHAAAPFAA